MNAPRLCPLAALWILLIASVGAAQPQPTPSATPPLIADCFVYFSSDVPKPIPDNSSVDSHLTLPSIGALSDINVIALFGQHPFVQDLEFHLISPRGTDVIIVKRGCAESRDFDLSLDDQAETGIPCPPTDMSPHQPDQPLSTFVGQSSGGVWTLRIFDRDPHDAGLVESWGLQVCVAATPPPTITSPTLTPTRTPTKTRTNTRGPSRTPTNSPTPAFSRTRTFSATITMTPTATPSQRPSPTPTPSPTISGTITLTPTVTPTATATCVAFSCPGDCNCDGEVTVDEILRGVIIALGTGRYDRCPAMDRNGDGEVTIDEIIAGVGHALGSCEASTPVPTPAATPAGDLGFARVTIHVSDVSSPSGSPIGGATVTFSRRAGGGFQHGPRAYSGSASSDLRGIAQFDIFLHDTDEVTFGAAAVGFLSGKLVFGGSLGFGGNEVYNSDRSFEIKLQSVG